jgi:hypothetical protein
MSAASGGSTTQEGREFVEHLRTVHFSLVLAAFALLAGAFLTRSAEVERAVAQLRDLRDLQPVWKADWNETGAKKEIDNLGLAPIEPDWLLSTGGAGPPVTVHIGTRWVTGMPSPHWVEIPGSQPGDFPRAISQSATNVSHFKEFWNFLVTPIQIIAAESISENAIIWVPKIIDVEPGHSPITEKKQTYPPNEFRVVKLTPIHQGEDRSKFKRTVGAGLHYLSAEFQQWVKAEPSLRSFAQNNEAPGYGFYCDLDDRFVLLIPAKTKETHFNGQAAFQTVHRTNFHYGKFEDTFAELNKITKNFQDLSDDRIQVILDDEANRTSERVEMFGAKIPGDALASWGSPILILLQFYFLLHLSKFRLLIPGWRGIPNVAWIGVYSSWSARLATLLSGMLLPSSVVSFLLVKQGAKFLHWWDWSLAILAMSLSAAIAVLSAICLLRTWRDKPPFNPQIA